MQPATFSDLLEDVRKHFSDPPKLNFPARPHNQLRYAFPEIAASNRPTTYGKPNKPQVHSALRPFFDAATKKYLYNTQYAQDWDDYIQFPNARLVSRKGVYRLVERPAAPREAGINPSRQAALAWIDDDFIPFISRSDGPAVVFATGEPGSGKSTLFKYLLNKKRASLREKRIIVSRFESLKFKDFCDKDFGDEDRVCEKLDEYILYILFRDIVYNLAYDHVPGQPIRRTQFGDFRSTLIYDMFEEIVTVDQTRAEKDRNILIDCIGEKGLDQKRLWDVSLVTRRALVARFAAKYTLCVVFDGLDYVCIAHNHFDPDTYRVLEVLINSFALRGSGRKTSRTVSFPFLFHSLFIMRNSTYGALFQDKIAELRSIKFMTWDVLPVPTEVVILNAINRGIAELCRDKTLESSEKTRQLAQSLMRSINEVLRYIDRQLDISQKKSYGVLRYFNGNIRDCFGFLERLLAWVLNEGRRALAIGGRAPAFRDAIAFLASDDVRPILVHRGYRIVEFLLFYEGAAFANSVTRNPGDVGDRIYQRSGPTGALRASGAYSGPVDNIFNYHIESHVDHLDGHCLLEKIRILQILTDGGRMSARRLGLEMEKQFGYRLAADDDGKTTLELLLFGGFIDIHLDEAQITFSPTRKGAAAIGRLIEQQVYLEHVFHKTLFPAQLIGHISDKARRDDRDAWIVSSIHSCFVFLCYIGCVEDNSANGTSVPRKYRVFGRIQESLLSSVPRILNQDYLEKRWSSQETWFVSKVYSSISKTIDLWRERDLLLEQR